jgi:hypothetical protein
MTHARWMAIWALAAVAFFGGVAWVLATETEVAYWLSLPLCLPLVVLIMGRPPRWLARIPAPAQWMGAVLIWIGGMTFFVVDQGTDSYFVVGLTCVPLVLLAMPHLAPAEGGSDGGGTWGPPDGFGG